MAMPQPASLAAVNPMLTQTNRQQNVKFEEAIEVERHVTFLSGQRCSLLPAMLHAAVSSCSNLSSDACVLSYQRLL